MKKLYKSDKNKVFAGIFGGIGEYSEVDPTILRIIFIFLVVFTGFLPGIIAYIFISLIIPKDHNNK